MNIKLFLTLALTAALSHACSSAGPGNASSPPSAGALNASPAPTPSPEPTVFRPKNGDYPGRGIVTKVNPDGEGSIEMDHEDIDGVMPAMRMEFFVADKKLLRGIAVGDRVDFILRYKNDTETLVDIRKTE